MAHSSYVKNFQIKFGCDQLCHAFNNHLNVKADELGTRGKKYESMFLIDSATPRTRLYELVLDMVEKEDDYLTVWMEDYADDEDVCLVMEELPKDISGKVMIQGSGLFDCDKIMLILGKKPSGEEFFVKTVYPFCGAYEPKVW